MFPPNQLRANQMQRTRKEFNAAIERARNAQADRIDVALMITGTLLVLAAFTIAAVMGA